MIQVSTYPTGHVLTTDPVMSNGIARFHELWDDEAWSELCEDVIRIRDVAGPVMACGDCGTLVGKVPASGFPPRLVHLDDLTDQCRGRADAAKRWPAGWFGDN
jgi:uncharacterized protein CbrC (UPF0167 family)